MIQYQTIPERKHESARIYAETCLRWLDDDDPDTRVQLYHERTYLNLSKAEAQIIESWVLQWKHRAEEIVLTESVILGELVEVG